MVGGKSRQSPGDLDMESCIRHIIAAFTIALTAMCAHADDYYVYLLVGLSNMIG